MGQERCWVVMPPGAGKTLVGLAHLHRFDSPAVVLCPNTAIQSQWVAAHRRYWGESGRSVGTERDLSCDVTVLTYQSIANFNSGGREDQDDDTDADDTDADRTDADRAYSDGADPAAPTGLVDSLHPNGQRLIAALRQLGEFTLVLDECHHLLQVWGRLLDEVLAELPRARVLGLTATPAESLTTTEAALTRRLFGDVVHSSTIPAAVRRGELAPFAELLWLTTPTASETDWLAEESERFNELLTRLTDPGFGSVGFLAWLDSVLIASVGSTRTWAEFERDSPALADAALRLHHRGLLALPDGARPPNGTATIPPPRTGWN